MRKACLEMVYELAKKDSRVIFIGSDLGTKTLQNLKEERPDQFLMEGISEGHLIGMAAGMALDGGCLRQYNCTVLSKKSI